MPVLELKNVSKSYTNKKVISDVSFSVNSGEIFGLLGPNGAGKTTLLRMFLDIIKPDSGAINVFGGTLDPDSKDRIGYLPEERGLYKKSKVIELLTYLAQLKGIPKKQALENAGNVLQSVGMYDQKDKKVDELSKGMQQKIQFLASIIHNPDFIIVDEPFSGLDPVNTKLIKSILLKHKKAGKTIVLSTHMMEQAQTLCDRILMINEGRVVLYDTVESIRREHRNNSVILEFKGEMEALDGLDSVQRIAEHETFVELFLKDGKDTQSLLGELVRRVEVLRFEQSIPSLNEIFIGIVESGTDE
ncbi:MAG: ATP-binding cassette domain-containing protein [Methanosarcinaceae archaeon]|nr:ATP-binding cassette domain-containing protein [Methanosarcinaceae archaeon]